MPVKLLKYVVEKASKYVSQHNSFVNGFERHLTSA